MLIFAAGVSNVYIGTSAGAVNSGSRNVSIGQQSSRLNTTGSTNTGLGAQTLFSNATGINNTALGYRAGFNATGNGNVYLGNQAGLNATGSDELYIDNNGTNTPLIYGDFANDSLKVYGTLSIGDSTTFPTTRGTNGQVLTSDGAGGINWSNAAVPNLSNVLASGNDAGSQSMFNIDTIAIGTTSPLALLHIEKGLIDGIRVNTTSATTQYFRYTQNNLTRIGGFISSGNAVLQMTNSSSSTNINLHTAGDSWLNGGNVGIGTNVPDSLLDVVGGAEIDRLNINSAYTFPTTTPTSGQVLRHNGSALEWGAVAPDTMDLIQDADGNTQIQVEESTNEDTIRFDIGGTEYFKMSTGRLGVLNTGQSIFLGEGAGANDDLTNNQNIYIGEGAGNATNSGNNVAIGYRSMSSASTGNNTAIGWSTLQNVTSPGQHNVAIGWSTLQSNTTGGTNTAVGSNSMNRITTGNRNTALGYRSLMFNVAGDSNVAVGYFTLENNLASFNTALGAAAMENNTTGTDNVGLGHRALVGNQTGIRNIGIGTNTGAANTSGSRNIYIGYNAGLSATGDDKLYIENSGSTSPLIYGDFANDSIKIYGTLSIGDSTTFPTDRGTNGQVLTSDGTGGTSWQNPSVGTINQIIDADGNTQIQVEETANDDIVRFDMNGTEFFRMDSGRFEVLNTGGSVFIGEGAGANDDYVNNQNAFIGSFVGNLNTSGIRNTAVGYEASRFNITGANNSAYGYQSLANNTADNNTGIGFQTLGLNTSGFQNVAVGGQAMLNNTTGQQNTALGFQALFSNNSGTNNTAIGRSALTANTASSNTAVGFSALPSNTSGTQNIGIGVSALNGNTAGNQNIGIGQSTGNANSNGSRNIYIGHAAGFSATGDDQLYIESSGSSTPLIYGDFANDSLKVYGTLSIGDSTTFPTTRGTNGQVLTSDGAGGINWTSLIFPVDGNGIYTGSGSLVTNTVVTQGANTMSFTSTATNGFSVDGTTFSVDAANDRVGIGTSTPFFPLHISHQFPEIYLESSNTGAENWRIINSNLTPGQEDNFRIYNNTDLADRLVIDGTGNVGIGTSTPVFPLHISHQFPEIYLESSNTGSENWRIMNSNLTPGQEDNFRIFNQTDLVDRLVIDGDGNIGIGTATPVSLLHINENVTASLNDGAFIDVQNNAGVARSLSGIRFKNNSFATSVRFHAAIFHRWTSGTDFQLNFAVRDNSVSDVVDTNDIRMTINDDGNVGIGTTSPSNPLTTLFNGSTINAATSAIQFGDNFGVGYWGAGSTAISLFDDTETIRFTVNQSTGNVGIGSNISPSQELDVEGDVQIDGDYFYESAKTRTYSVSAAAFTPLQGNSGLATTQGLEIGGFLSGNARWIAGGALGDAGYMYAPVSLPDGAIVSEVVFYVYDNDNGEEVTGEMYRQTFGASASTQMALTGGSGVAAQPASTSISDVTITNSTIDNSSYSYYLRFNTEENNNQLRVYGARIRYTVTQAD